GWVIFDAGLVIALGRLRRSGSLTLARVIAAAVSLDAVLTLVQAVVHTVPAARSADALTFASSLGIAVACAGPLVAAPVLWGAARRLARLQHGQRRVGASEPRHSRTTG
ncbi:MAG: hypothetical protein ABIW79_03395, partial [Gemmatimonas sp.]